MYMIFEWLDIDNSLGDVRYFQCRSYKWHNSWSYSNNLYDLEWIKFDRLYFQGEYMLIES